MAERLSDEELDFEIYMHPADGSPLARRVRRALVELRERRAAVLSDGDKGLLRWALSHTAANSVDDAEVERLRALLVRLGAVEGS